MTAPDLAVVVTTYQMPWHLQRCLESIRCQKTSRRLEVIVADDGSLDDTQAVVNEFARMSVWPVHFVTHEHAGFQAARCRNDGVRQSAAPHLLFVDGDCVLPPHHVEAHLVAHRPGTVTSGYCVRLSEAASREVTMASIERGKLECHAPTDELRKLASLHRKAWWYNLIGHASKPALRSTDFSLSRTDFERVNGFDEQYRGWGCEDDDLGRRLKAVGVKIVSVLDRTRVFHLWHPPAPSKTPEWRDGANVSYFQRPVRLTRCLAGLVPRTSRDLTVRIAGETRNSTSLVKLIRKQGWQIECDAARRADVELLAWPGHGRFHGQSDCRILAILDDTLRLPWSGRRAHLVLSPSGNVGRTDQIRLRLTDVAALCQALLVDPACRAGSDRAKEPRLAVPGPARQAGPAMSPSSLMASMR